MKITKRKSERRGMKSRIFFFHNNESILDNLINRHDRPQKAYRQLLPQIMEQNGFNGKVRWSQRAGCSCPCSPGFIVDGWNGGVDLYVHLENEVSNENI